MTPAILGKKIGMTRIFDESGVSVAVTLVQAGPCPVLQVKTKDSDGYEAVQIGYAPKKPGRCTFPEIGHARKAGAVPQQFTREIRLMEPSEQKAGDAITVASFEAAGVKWVDVVGTSIGKGFQGVMKRHHFAGQESSHGVERKHRSAGGIGGCGSRGGGRGIKKGKRMPGQMGHERCTVRNQKLISVDAERNILVIEGGVPGPRGGYVIVSKAQTRQ